MTSFRIEPLVGLESVRKRPGMYVGDLGNGIGLHNLLWEVLDNAFAETLRVGGERIELRFDGDRATVEDFGAGIPVDEVVLDGVARSGVETVMTMLSAGARLGTRAHPNSRMWGIGVAPVNAMSREMHVEVWRDGWHHEQRYVRGVPVAPLARLGATTRTGTRVAFAPDRDIFPTVTWDRTQILTRCRGLAALAPRATIVVDGVAHHFADGLASFVDELAGAPLVDPLTMHATDNDVTLDLALGWRRGRGSVQSFVNHRATTRGTHVDGLYTGVSRAFARRVPGYARAKSAAKRFAPHLVAAIAVTSADPSFGDSERSWLRDPGVGAIVAHLVERALLAHFERGPMLDAILLER